MKAMGIKPSRTAFRRPWQNGFVGRWVGSVRRELLNHVVILNEPHLRRLLNDYVIYYHTDRTHSGLQKDTPLGRPTSPRRSQNANLVSLSRVGGLHRRYEWRDAA